MPFLIVVGDKISHGGVVIDSTSATDIDGKKIVRVGDHATCPIRGHGLTTTIVSGDPTLIIDDKPAARHGDRTACGATLISSQATTSDDPGSAAGIAQSSSSGSNAAAAISALGLAIAVKKAFDIHFQLEDEKTGKPLADVPYRLSLPDGTEIKGKTDGKGFTDTIAVDSAAIAKLEAPYYGDSSSNSDSHGEHGTCGC